MFLRTLEKIYGFVSDPIMTYFILCTSNIKVILMVVAEDKDKLLVGEAEEEVEAEVEVGVVAFKGGEVCVAGVAQPEVVAVAAEASGVEGDFRTAFCNIFCCLFCCHFWMHDLTTMTNLC